MKIGQLYSPQDLVWRKCPRTRGQHEGVLDKSKRLCNLLGVGETKKETKRNDRDLENIAALARETFQSLLRAHVEDKKDIDQLAKVLDKTPSLVKKMLYKGEGGLDVWIKALAYLYGFTEKSFVSFQEQLREKNVTATSDKIWFSIKSEMGASEEDARYLAEIARESYRIKKELEGIKKKSK